MKNIEHLMRLANRIGQFFVNMPDAAEGREGVVNHLQKFWAPRMRIALLDYLETHPDGACGETALDPWVKETILDAKARLRPAQ